MGNKQDSPPYNPLDIPEIRDLIAHYLDRKDFLSCIRVSRDWFLYFILPIWKTIDFEKDATTFTKIASGVLNKYGRFISQAVNISDLDHLQALQHSKVNSLKFIKVQLSISCIYQQILSDTIRRSEGSLQLIDIFAEPSDPDTLAEQRKHGKHFFNTADAISSLPKSSGEGCVMRQDICRFCPILKDIRFDQGDPATTSALLAKTFEGLESCTLSTQVLAASTVLGLIAHQDSLTSIAVTKSIIGGDTETLKDASTMQWLYMIPLLCPHLQILSLEPFICDIDEIENHNWACGDLQELRVRVKGLDDPQDIKACLKQVCLQKRVCQDAVVFKDKATVVARVAQYLLQFKRLRIICLGTQVYNLPSCSA
ncbi:hypothetical protein BGX24_010112 [Mortierella sp. AD032]|nr:hypothetical protein BGX24_010112 [Mortierella sp. AD032]